jgi:hypothetical protein
MFRPASCSFAVPPGANVQCGWLTVPEDRSKVDGDSIRLHIAIYKSRSPRPGQIRFCGSWEGLAAARTL